jgi:antitoxin MazE
MEEQGSQIVIRSAHRVREGWAEAFARMAANGDDALLDAPLPTEWDQSEWEW